MTLLTGGLLMIDTEPTLYESGEVRITPSALLVRGERIAHDQIESVVSASHPDVEHGSTVLGVGVACLTTAVCVAVWDVLRARDPWMTLAVVGAVGVALTGTGLWMRWRTKNACVVRVRLRSGAWVAVAPARDERAAAPLRDALVRAVATSAR